MNYELQNALRFDLIVGIISPCHLHIIHAKLSILCRTDPGNTTTSDYLVTVFLARRNQISGVYEVVKKFSEENPVEMVFPLEDLKVCSHALTRQPLRTNQK